MTRSTLPFLALTLVTLSGCFDPTRLERDTNVDAAPASADDANPSPARLQVTATSSANGGAFAPTNVAAIWVETQAGELVRTIHRHSAVRTGHLVAWVAKAGIADLDAVSGATRLNHLTPLTADWTVTNRLNVEIPDGTYVLRMEIAEQNSTIAAENRQGTFTFTKGPTPQTQTGLENGGFANVSIMFTPASSSGRAPSNQLHSK